MRKNQNRKLFHLVFKLITVIFALTVFSVLAKADSNGQTLVTLKATNAGVPVAYDQFSAINLQNAYTKISTGAYSDQDLTSAAWNTMLQNYEHKGKTIQLTTKYVLTPKHG